MRIQLNSNKLNWSVTILLMLLVSFISACNSSEIATVAPTSDQPDEIEGTNSEITKEIATVAPTSDQPDEIEGTNSEITKEIATVAPTSDQPDKIEDTNSEITKIAADLLENDVGEVSLIGDSISDKKVIIFEESHASRAGQLEIAIMLVRLHDDYGMKYIALEGALDEDGPLDASQYHQLTDSDTLADVAVQMLKKGEINNAELIAMTLPDVTVQGIEIAEEYEVEPGEDSSSAPTLYLLYIALPSLTDDETGKFNELYDANKVLEAVEFVISTDEWAQSQYEKLTDSDSILSAEELLVVMEEIEAKADEVNAPVEADLQANFQDYKHFFEVASHRSDTMVNNTLALLDKYPEAPVAMIIGAAHTAKVSDLLDNQGISHAVIRPRALATEEPGELTFEAYDRKLKALSVDEVGELGALLDDRKKPPPVLQQRWFQIEAEVKLVTTKIARAVANGAKPPFDEPPYDLQTEFANYRYVSVNWDSIVIEEPEVKFSLDVKIDEAGNVKHIFGRAVQTDEPSDNVTDTPLEQLLLAALEDVKSETSTQTEEQTSYDNENPAITQIAHNIDAKFSDSERGISTPISTV